MRYFLILLLCALPVTSHAIQVKNFSDAPQTVELERNPGSVQRVTIAAGDSVYLTGRGMLRMADKPVESHVTRGVHKGFLGASSRGLEATKRDLFIIWENGVLTHQMRRKGLGRL